jgi:hypothetical protein
MNPAPQTEPPDEPPAAWWKRDVERRLEEMEARVTAN